ncbi:MAG: ligase-associated DNA damage response endonuclease PdeM [Phycisphaerales bacterium]|nr:ligase-associated DNA damage response endonuclease PdeM [Phycisphaerales bacterium]
MIGIEWAGERLELSAERALLWPARRTLLIADVHLGKPAAFRAAGVPVPEETTQRDLTRLGGLLTTTGAERVIVLGDLLHARAGRTPVVVNTVTAWRARHRQADIVLVRGNHDLHAGDPPEAWEVRCVDEPWGVGGMRLCHRLEADTDAGTDADTDAATDADADADAGTDTDTDTDAGTDADADAATATATDAATDPDTDAAPPPVIAGHLHPGVRLHDIDAGGGSLRCPCFVFGPRRALLPAFGSFTGLAIVRPRVDDRIFAVGPEVVEVRGRWEHRGRGRGRRRVRIGGASEPRPMGDP